jgi:hypothetical protein
MPVVVACYAIGYVVYRRRAKALAGEVAQWRAILGD